MINTRPWNYLFQTSEQARISPFRVFFLASLVIFPAEHDVIEAAAFIDSQIIVRLSRIPKEGFRNCPDWDSGAEDVAGIQRKFCLEKRRGRHAGQADKWVVRCHYHAIETDPVAVDFHPALLRIEFTGCAVFKNVRTAARNFRNQRSKIFSGVKLGLIGKAHRRQIKVWGRV